MEGVPAVSLLDCIDDEGEVDFALFLQLQRSQMEYIEDMDEWATALVEEEEAAAAAQKNKTDARSVASNRSKRTVKKHNTLLYRDTDGSNKSIWYLNYLENPRPSDAKWNEKFQKRFRMSHESFVELGMMVEASPKFDRWKKKDAYGPVPEKKFHVKICCFQCLLSIFSPSLHQNSHQIISFAYPVPCKAYLCEKRAQKQRHRGMF